MNFAGPKRRGGIPRKYTITDEARAMIVARYQPLRRDTGRSEIAADLGVPPWVVGKWAAQLGIIRRKEPFWTDAELDYLRESVGRIAWKKIAKKLGRTVVSVKLQAKRHTIRVRDMDASSATDLATLLGVDPKRVLAWVERGWLVSSQDGKAARNPHRFTRSALRAFLRDHGHALDLSRVHAGWLFSLAFGEPEWHGDTYACRHCGEGFTSRLETRVPTVCAGCASREHGRCAA